MVDVRSDCPFLKAKEVPFRAINICTGSLTDHHWSLSGSSSPARATTHSYPSLPLLFLPLFGQKQKNRYFPLLYFPLSLTSLTHLCYQRSAGPVKQDREWSTLKKGVFARFFDWSHHSYNSHSSFYSLSFRPTSSHLFICRFATIQLTWDSNLTEHQDIESKQSNIQSPGSSSSWHNFWLGRRELLGSENY